MSAAKTAWAWARRQSRVAAVAAALISLGAIGLAVVAIEAVSLAYLDDGVAPAPTRIYSRPFVLYLGMRPSRARVEEQLGRLGYVPAADQSVEPGEYRLGSRVWRIALRPFRHHERVRPGGMTTVRLGYRGQITRLDDGGRGGRTSVEYVALEPELIGSFSGESKEDRLPVRLQNVSVHLVDAVLSIEDQRFFDHRGLDFWRIAAATVANLRAGRIVQGASTLTQQLAKNLYLSPRRSLIRKLREAGMALVLERRYSKQTILEAYLNEVYLGQDGALAIHGVGRAAQHYFDKNVSALDLGEAATLAGLIRGPSLYSPSQRPEAAMSRRNVVLRRMLERGVISGDEYLEARKAPLDLRRRVRPTRSARYFVDFVGAQLRASHGRATVEGGGLAAFTTLDMRLQRAAEAAVRQGLSQLEERYPGLAAEDVPLQAALVALDPRSGTILAMVGGRDYGESQFNRAVNAHRQPGSAFKPIVTLAALSQRGWGDDEDRRPFTLASVLEDESLTVETPQGPWQPVNYDRRFRGRLSLREALERSLNVPFARLGLAVGPARIVETARALGIEGPLNPVPSLALGSSEVSLLELTRAYGVLAAGGFLAESRANLVTLDRDGKLLDRSEGTGEQVYDPAEAYLVTSALRGAVDHGTGRGLWAMGYRGDVAAKSGTTNNFRDGWFIGYTPSLAVGVWVGFDDGRSIDLPGARVALPIFARFLIDAVGPYGDDGMYGDFEFSRPPGLEIVEVEPTTGLRAGPGCRGRRELFLRGTAPQASCSPLWRLVRGRRGRRFERGDDLSRLHEQLRRLWERETRNGDNRDPFE